MHESTSITYVRNVNGKYEHGFNVWSSRNIAFGISRRLQTERIEELLQAAKETLRIWRQFEKQFSGLLIRVKWFAVEDCWHSDSWWVGHVTSAMIRCAQLRAETLIY